MVSYRPMKMRPTMLPLGEVVVAGPMHVFAVSEEGVRRSCLTIGHVRAGRGLFLPVLTIPPADNPGQARVGSDGSVS